MNSCPCSSNASTNTGMLVRKLITPGCMLACWFPRSQLKGKQTFRAGIRASSIDKNNGLAR